MKGKPIALLIWDMTNSSIVVNATNSLHFKQLGTEKQKQKQMKLKFEEKKYIKQMENYN